MEIPHSAWKKYTNRLRSISKKASDELIKFIQNGHNPYIYPEMVDEVIKYAYALATKYGEAAGSLACEMYDLAAELSRAVVPSAVPAATAKYGEVARTVQGIMLQSSNPELMGSGIDRLVKMVSVDTMQENALRDGWEWAWIPSGDTCAFCIMLASNGWQPASRKARRGGHAEHVHANCDCTYMVRPIGSTLDVEGYNDGEEYRKMYYDADGSSPEERVNAMRREFYAENKEEINEQKRDAYEKRKELNSSAAEEYEVTE